MWPGTGGWRSQFLRGCWGCWGDSILQLHSLDVGISSRNALMMGAQLHRIWTPAIYPPKWGYIGYIPQLDTQGTAFVETFCHILSASKDIRNDLKLFFWCCFHLSKFVWKTWPNWHSGITTWRQADATLQQSLVLCLENRVQTTENLMKMTLGEWIG